MHQVRQALLEADVNYEVDTDFIDGTIEEAVSKAVLKSLNPTEQIVGVVYNHLVDLMGPVDHSLRLKRDEIIPVLAALQHVYSQAELRKMRSSC